MPVANKGHSARVEAARYALLRRIAPAIRHALVGKLHPIGLMSEAMTRRLQSAPDVAQAKGSLEKIHTLARSAITASADLISWVAPEEGSTTGLVQGVEECLGLLGTDLSMRGHSISSEIEESMDVRVSRTALRTILSALLIAQADALVRPSDLAFSASTEGGVAILRVRVQNARREAMPPSEDAYRRLAWKEVRLLADAENAQLSRKGRVIELRLPIIP